jgi:hypothetical protein
MLNKRFLGGFEVFIGSTYNSLQLTLYKAKVFTFHKQLLNHRLSNFTFYVDFVFVVP